MPATTLVTVELDEAPATYLEFWDQGWFRRAQSQALTQRCLETLSGHYALRTEPTTSAPQTLAHTYAATLIDDQLAPATETCIRLGIRFQAHILIDPRGRKCSFALSTDREAAHILCQHFPDLTPIPHRTYQDLSRGRHHKPRRLTKLSLHQLPGVEPFEHLPVPLPETPDANTPSIRLGRALHPVTALPGPPAHIPLQRLTRGTLVAGTTGSGKTNAVMALCQETARQNVGLLVFDPKKDYRSLHETHDATVLGFSGDNIFTHNLLKPIGDPGTYLKQFASIFSEVISRNVPASGSKDMITEVLDRLYRERGIYEGSTNYPHIGHLLSALEDRARDAQAPRERNWISSALRVLRSLHVGSTRTAFHVREGQSLQRLRKGIVVVETGGIGDPAGEALLVSVLLQKLRNQLEQDPPEASLRQVIVIEEAQNILARGQEATSTITTTCREIRGYGVGLVFVTQTPTDFSKDALANVNTVLSMRLRLPEDRRLMTALLGLDKTNAPLLGELEVGQGLLSAESLALVQVDLVERPFVPDHALPATKTTREDVAASVPQRRSVTNKVDRLAPRDLEVLKAIAQGTYIYPTALKNGLGRSQHDIQTSLKTLRTAGLVYYVKANKQGPGRARSVYFLSKHGHEACRQRLARYPDINPAKSPNHKHLVQTITQALGIERKPDREFDILYDTDEGEAAIEVESGANKEDQIRRNISKSLDRFGEARFAGADERVCNRVLQAACSLAWDEKRAMTLHITTVEELSRGKGWTTFYVDPKPSTP